MGLTKSAKAAIAAGTRIMMRDPTGNINRVYWGRQIRHGQPTGEGVVFGVKSKGNAQAQAGAPVPKFLDTRITDVQEAPPAEIELLRYAHFLPPIRTAAAGPHQNCFNTPIPGGVEIQPVGKQWLGTGGCKVIAKRANGTLFHAMTTNWHVATGVVGQKLVQPGGSNKWFAKVASSPGVKFDGSPNYVDLAILDIYRNDAEYAPGTHTVKPEQVTLGKYQQELSDGDIGTKLCRDGRTLGRLVDGEVTGVGASVRVGYGPDGTALYLDQVLGQHPSGQFSAPGDSGSMVFEWPSMKPFGKLFAGGGGTTIISPAKYMLNPGRVHSFQ